MSGAVPGGVTAKAKLRNRARFRSSRTPALSSNLLPSSIVSNSVDRAVPGLGVRARGDGVIDRPGIECGGVGDAVDRQRSEGRSVGIARQLGGLDPIILPGRRSADDQDVAQAPRGAGLDPKVGLVVDQLVLLVANPAARTGRLIETGGEAGRTGKADRRGGACGDRLAPGRREAEDALGRARPAVLADPLPAGEVAHRNPVAELVVEGGGEAVDRDVLPVEVAVAEIVAVAGLLERPVMDLAAEERHAVDRDVAVFLVEVGESQAGRTFDPEGDRRSHAPPFICLEVAARDVVAVDHRVQANRDEVVGAMVDVDRGPVIIVGAGRRGQDIEAVAPRRLGHEIDRSADRSRSVEHGIGAVIDLDLLQVERIGAAILGAVAHAVLGEVVVRRIAAQIDAVAIAAAALAGAERDPGHGGERVAQGQQILLPDHLVADHGDRLRRVDQRLGRFGSFELLLVMGAGDDDGLAAALLVVIAGKVGAGSGFERSLRGISGGGGDEADAAQSEKQGRRRRRAATEFGTKQSTTPSRPRSSGHRPLLQVIRRTVKRLANDSQLGGLTLWPPALTSAP